VLVTRYTAEKYRLDTLANKDLGRRGLAVVGQAAKDVLEQESLEAGKLPYGLDGTGRHARNPAADLLRLVVGHSLHHAGGPIQLF